MKGFHSPSQPHNSRREWQRRAAAATKITTEMAEQYAELEKQHNEAMKDIRAVLDLLYRKPYWPFVSRGVIAILKKYRQ